MRWLVLRETEIRMNTKPSEWRRSWLVKGADSGEEISLGWRKGKLTPQDDPLVRAGPIKQMPPHNEVFSLWLHYLPRSKLNSGHLKL